MEPDYRGGFSSVESAFQNAFELMAYTSTIIWDRPEYFRYPTFLSVGAVFLAMACYTMHVKEVRGHLFHPEKACLCCRERWRVA